MAKRIHIDLKRGETLTIGGATVRLEQKSGQVARLVIEADERTPIKTPGDMRKAADIARRSALPANAQEGAHAHRLHS